MHNLVDLPIIHDVLEVCAFILLYTIQNWSTITVSLQSFVFKQTDVLHHLITLLTPPHTVYYVIRNLLPHYRIMHHKQQTERLLQPQLKSTSQHIFHYLPADLLSLRQPVHYLYLHDLHLLRILLVLAQLQIQIAFLLLSPLGRHRAFYDDVLLDGGVGSGSVEIDLSLRCQSHHLIDGLYFGQFVLEMVSDFNFERHEILVDLGVFDFYLQIDACVGFKIFGDFVPDGCLQQSDGCLQLDVRWIRFGLLYVVAEEEAEFRLFEDGGVD